MEGLSLTDPTRTALLKNRVIGNGSYLIISSESTSTLFSSYGDVIGVSSFPPLGNSKDSLVLSINDIIIDRVMYEDDWYRDMIKDDGGYTLERIGFTETCVDELNWIASESPEGGTPGGENSVVNFPPDEDEPLITSFELIEENQIRLIFNEPMDSLSLVNGNYSINNDITIEEVTDVIPGARAILLMLDSKISDGIIYTLVVSNISDCAGNLIEPSTFEFGNGDIPLFNELIITEIMADPDPAQGLPSAEYLEIYNASDKNLELNGLELADNNSETVLNAGILFPGEYAILLPNGSVSLYQGVKVFGVSNWPSLSNSGELISISNGDQLVFSVEYSDEWYKDSEKSDGGFSIEMIDITNACGGISNWTASESPLGGTPAIENSVATDNPDNLGPQLTEAIAIDDMTVKLLFDEKLNPEQVVNGNFSLSPEIIINGVALNKPAGSMITIHLSNPLESRQVYQVVVNNISDCAGNLIRSEANSSEFVLPELASDKDLILNEILFNPRSGGVDFVEVYNNSQKAINIKNWFLANLDTNGELNLRQITADDLVINPMEYLVFTTEPVILKADYPSGNEDVFIPMASFPSYPNDEGSAILLNDLEEIMDQFDYNEDLHFILLDDVDGVSLERISFDSDTNDPNNWKSAASTAGFATPGLRNSQFKTQSSVTGVIEVDPKVFVPDNTGVNDFTTINFDLQNVGSFANVSVYDQRGRLVKTLSEGDLLSTSGFFTWDGTDNSGRRASYGYYVVYFEIFDSNGNKEIMKETIVLGARF